MADVVVPPAMEGFEPEQEDLAAVEEWFTRYDALAAKGEIEAMADMAMFPLNMVTDDGRRDGSAWQVDREQYLRDMAQVVGDGATLQSTRTPHFLSRQLVFVVTDATTTVDGQTHRLRYGDLLVKRAGHWYFQTMVQGGWAAP